MGMRPASLPGRPGARYLAIAALCTAAATACGSTAAGSSASGPGQARPAKVSLHVTVTSASSQPKTFTLRCDPPGGTHPDPAAACRVLLAARDPFAPLPKGIMCPMIVAGTKRATVTGTWFGQKVRTTMFDGGCWMARWHKVGQIFN